MAGENPGVNESKQLCERHRHDRISDIARLGWSGRDRGVGGIFVSAEIIHFIPPPNPDRQHTDFYTIAFGSVALADDLAHRSCRHGALRVCAPSFRAEKRRRNPSNRGTDPRDLALLRAACHRARVRATRWPAMTISKQKTQISDA